MKTLLFATVAATILSVLSPIARADFNDDLKKMEKQMKDAGINLDVLDRNPFQTGTTLQGYFMSQNTLLLERDAWFQLKANPLKSTEDAADFAFRLRVLRSHANNMFLQLLQALEKRNEDGFVKEEEKNKQEYEKLLEECRKDPACVANKLQDPSVQLKNVLIDNFALSTQVFAQIPYMHSLEANAVYQLIELMYLEVMNGQNRLSLKEFDLFVEKQETLDKTLAENHNLSKAEKELQRGLIRNAVMKWKKKILERKYDQAKAYEGKAQELAAKNRALAADITNLRKGHADLFGDLYRTEDCGMMSEYREVRDYMFCRQKGEDKELLEKEFRKIEAGQLTFIGKKEKDLPKKFWNAFK